MKRRYSRMLPKNLHLMPSRGRVVRACGAEDGGFVRERDAAWLKKHLRDGGDVCPKCKGTDVFARMTA